MYNTVIDYLSKNWPKLAGFVLILLVGYFLVKLLLRITKKGLARTHLEPTSHKFMLELLKIVLYILVAVIALSQLNVDMTSIITMLGVGGVAVSLAVKDSLANVAGGFILLFTKPFKVGDFIESEGLSGTVSQINILQTKLTTFDNKAVFIPNGQLSAAKITNYSAEETRMLVIPVSIGYGESISRARQVLFSLIDADERIRKDPAPNVYVTAHAASSIDLSMRLWVKTGDYWAVNFEMMEKIKETFDANGISIPFNQLDVHLDALAVEALPAKEA